MRSRFDRYEITYKRDGRTYVHVNHNSEGDARGWTESLAREHGGATCERVSETGRRTHIVTEGER